MPVWERQLDGARLRGCPAPVCWSRGTWACRGHESRGGRSKSVG